MIALESIVLKQGVFSFSDLSFEVDEGAYAVLMGASGSGKTTLLELICGLRHPSSGKVLIGGRDMTAAVPAARKVGYVPQDGALFRTMTVRENIGFALEVRKRPAEEIESAVRMTAELLGIASLLDRRPEGLSGGERQRTALGRALAFRPKLLLLDEPLSALDEETRVRITGLLKEVHAQTGVTILHVTHNPREAEALATVGLKIENGQITNLELKPIDPIRV